MLRSQFPCHCCGYWSRSADKEQSKSISQPWPLLATILRCCISFRENLVMNIKPTPKNVGLKVNCKLNFYWKFQPTMTTILFWNSYCSNRPLPSSKNSRFQNETKCKTFVVKMSIILEVLIEEGSAAVSCDANRTKTVCRTVEHMNSFL